MLEEAAALSLSLSLSLSRSLSLKGFGGVLGLRGSWGLGGVLGGGGGGCGGFIIIASSKCLSCMQFPIYCHFADCTTTRSFGAKAIGPRQTPISEISSGGREGGSFKASPRSSKAANLLESGLSCVKMLAEQPIPHLGLDVAKLELTSSIIGVAVTSPKPIAKKRSASCAPRWQLGEFNKQWPSAGSASRKL